MKLYFVLLIKSHLLSYPCPIIINYLWNIGFLLGITIILQIITGIFLGLHYTSDLTSAYFSIFQIIREIYYGWCLRYLHSSGASFFFLFLFLHLGRAISYGSYFYNPNTWFSGILLFFFQFIESLIWRNYFLHWKYKPFCNTFGNSLATHQIYFLVYHSLTSISLPIRYILRLEE